MVPGKDAEGFLDGTASDYESSWLLKPDCHFSRFARNEFPDPETVAAIEASGGMFSTKELDSLPGVTSSSTRSMPRKVGNLVKSSS
eukprot:TRINITY_DN3750_c0_g2_i1.p2 TRINITY_DN3750_c0_g2~~TRINITY_DN3750_c0_g2_i1.p2  ORF type:complete len:101 (-),score=17.33 TRINITY_DN3750_c0_g2_i1:373-630(-)